MKKIILILFVSITFYSCDKKNSLSELNLKGNVESVVESTYEAEEKFGDIEKDEFEYSFKQEFNEDGNKFEETWYDEEGELTSKWKFEYDDDGNQIEETQYKEEGELAARWKYKYDDDGNLVEETWYYEEGELPDKYEYKYDDDGNDIEMKLTYYIRDKKTTVIFTYEYEEYDKKGNWTKKIIYRDDEPYEIEERDIEYY